MQTFFWLIEIFKFFNEIPWKKKIMGANGSNYSGWTHGPGYCDIAWWMRVNWNHLNPRKRTKRWWRRGKKKDMFKSLSSFFSLTKMSVKWWEARPSPPHLHSFLPLLVFMGTYSSFQSFLWITDAASRSCSLLCSLTITSLERLWFVFASGGVVVLCRRAFPECGVW